jgi:hypothetical protein
LTVPMGVLSDAHAFADRFSAMMAIPFPNLVPLLFRVAEVACLSRPMPTQRPDAFAVPYPMSSPAGIWAEATLLSSSAAKIADA